MNLGDRDKGEWIIRFAEGGKLDSSHGSGKIILRIGPKGCLERFSETVHEFAMNTVRSLGEIDLHRFFIGIITLILYRCGKRQMKRIN
jgi:hypothetical protein